MNDLQETELELKRDEEADKPAKTRQFRDDGNRRGSNGGDGNRSQRKGKRNGTKMIKKDGNMRLVFPSQYFAVLPKEMHEQLKGINRFDFKKALLKRKREDRSVLKRAEKE